MNRQFFFACLVKYVCVLLDVVHEQIGGRTDEEVVAVHVGVQLPRGDGGHALVDVQHDQIAVVASGTPDSTPGQDPAGAGTHVRIWSVNENLRSIRNRMYIIVKDF